MRKPNTPPPRGLHKALSVLAAGVMLTAGMAALPVNAATTSYPDHIVNGDFEYPVNAGWDKDLGEIDPVGGWGGFYSDVPGATKTGFKQIPNFDSSKFGWRSNQTGLPGSNQPTSVQRLQNSVQLSYTTNANGTPNEFAEICAEQQGEYIYQDIATTPGATYTWTLQHMSTEKSHADSMQVLIGAPGKETPQQAYRTTVNGGGDKIGNVGTTITTQNVVEGLNTDYRSNMETYTGKYVVPAGQTVTRFTFKSLKTYDMDSGNIVDNIGFKISYPLKYDLKGGSGTTPQQHD